MIFFTANTMAIDARTTTMNNVAINGNSGILGVGVGDEEDEEGVEDADELAVASTVPLKSL